MGRDKFFESSMDVVRGRSEQRRGRQQYFCEDQLLIAKQTNFAMLAKLRGVVTRNLLCYFARCETSSKWQVNLPFWSKLIRLLEEDRVECEIEWQIAIQRDVKNVYVAIWIDHKNVLQISNEYNYKNMKKYNRFIVHKYKTKDSWYTMRCFLKTN